MAMIVNYTPKPKEILEEETYQELLRIMTRHDKPSDRLTAACVSPVDGVKEMMKSYSGHTRLLDILHEKTIIERKLTFIPFEEMLHKLADGYICTAYDSHQNEVIRLALSENYLHELIKQQSKIELGSMPGEIPITLLKAKLTSKNIFDYNKCRWVAATTKMKDVVMER